uniref:2'-5'-oligoadenylate synthase 3-like n=1 Tax=Jaculus jaculus TaxID=51337 RepID=UPI001E1B2BCE|nr:2'-5'-oligoadenylate synthase 3-like [Jaculus jaculus]
MAAQGSPPALDKLLALGSATQPAGARGANPRIRGCGDRGWTPSPVHSCHFSSEGGSYAWGRALRGGCDIDFVIFLACFKSYGDQMVHRTAILSDLRGLLESWCWDPQPGLSLQFPQQNESGDLHFRLTSADLENWMDVSLMPAFDILGQPSSGVKPKPQVYASLLGSGGQGGKHAACFAELRRNFVNTLPAKVKNLILLVKQWGCQPARSLPPNKPLDKFISDFL